MAGDVWDDGFVRVWGSRVRVRRAGEGPPLVLVAPLGTSLELWGPLAGRLGPRELIAFDWPGGGGFDPTGSFLGVTALGRLALRLFDELELESPDVLGLSFGGAVVQQLAYDAPDRIGRLVLVSTNAGVGSLLGRPEALGVWLNPWLLAASMQSDTLARIVYGGPKGTDKSTATAGAIKIEPHSAWRQMWALSTWSSLPWLDRVLAPALIVSGDCDPLVPIENARSLARLLPRGELYTVADGGHLALFDRIVEVAPVIEQFLNGGLANERLAITGAGAKRPSRR